MKRTALIVDSGARGAAMQWAIERNPNWQASVMPGNAQTYREGFPTPSKSDEIVDFVQKIRPDLTIIGPEAYLDEGLADRLRAVPAFHVVGPSEAAAKLETSKGWARRFMRRHSIPHPKFRIADSIALAILAYESGLTVIKADGLAAGKGVVLPESRLEAGQAIHRMMVEKQFGKAGKILVMEERMVGPEVSLMVVTDGVNAVPLRAAADKKRRFEGDKGPNTGSMGCYSTTDLLSQRLIDEAMEDIVYPTLRGMTVEGYPYQGFLYVSLMLTEDGPKVVEFNVRPGDPEIVGILPLLESDFTELMLKSTEKDGLKNYKPKWANLSSVDTVMVHDWYPGKGSTGAEITGLDEAAALKDVLVFHAGTSRAQVDGSIRTSGGRVINVVGIADDLETAWRLSIAGAELINFEGKAYRRDIAK